MEPEQSNEMDDQDPGGPGHEFGRELRAARDIAREAGVLVRAYFERWHGQDAQALKVQLKDAEEPVTEADQRASALIVSRLAEAFPDDVILSEEAAERDSVAARSAGRVWLVDPIDGTKDFIAGRNGFAVMIGLLRDGAPVVGVVHPPLFGEVYEGVAGHGAFSLAPDGTRRRLAVSSIASLADARMVSSYSHRSETVDKLRQSAGIKDELNIGSLGLKLALIAAGERDLYANPGGRAKLWDTCAPEVLLIEAGGTLSDCHGAKVDYRSPDLALRRGLLATNGRFHAAALERLAPLLPASLR